MSCINYFENIFEDTISSVRSSLPGTVYIIKHPDGRELKIDGDIVRLNRGTPTKFVKYVGNVYYKEYGRIALLANGNIGQSLRHAGAKIYVHQFGENNYDFAWCFWYISENQYYIYNDFRMDGDVTWLGYDSSIDQLVICKRFDPRTILWTVEIHDDPRNKLKALAFMQEDKENKKCLYPTETIKTVNFSDKCKLRNYENGQILQDNFNTEKNGCSIGYDNKPSMKQSIKDVSHNIVISNNLALQELKNKIIELNGEVDSLWNEILQKTKKFQKSLKRYDHAQDVCQGAKDIVDWAENTAFPDKNKEIVIKYKERGDIDKQVPKLYKKYEQVYQKCEDKIMRGWNRINSESFASISASDNIICGITPSNDTYCSIIGDSNWKKLDSKLNNISVDGKQACGVDTSGNIVCTKDVLNEKFKYIHDGFKQVDISGDKLCATTIYDQIVCSDFKDGNIENPKFIPGSLKHISIDGKKTCGTNYQDNIWCADDFDNPQWTFIQGSLKQIDLNNNKMCGINYNNNVFCARYKQNNWTQLNGDFKHVSMNNDTLYGTTASNILQNPYNLYSRKDV